jgi:hypothetical protein
MEYDKQDLDEFINVLISYSVDIKSNTQPHPYKKNHTSSLITLKPDERRFEKLLFPDRDADLLGLTTKDKSLTGIYDYINSRFSGLDIDYIDNISVWNRGLYAQPNESFKISLTMRPKEIDIGGLDNITIPRDDCKSFRTSVIMNEKKGGKKRSRKRMKSTKKKRHIKKKRHTKKRR